MCIHKQDIGNCREKLEHKEHDAPHAGSEIPVFPHLSIERFNEQSRYRISMACRRAMHDRGDAQAGMSQTTGSSSYESPQ
jgi:hypothetical protein